MIESINTPPAGYIDLGTALVHVSKVRQYTSDIHRFREYLPLAVQLDCIGPDHEDAFAVYSAAPDVSLLILTLTELANLNFEMADQLRVQQQ